MINDYNNKKLKQLSSTQLNNRLISNTVSEDKITLQTNQQDTTSKKPLTIELLKETFEKVFLNKSLRKEYDTPEILKRFSITEISGCLFKNFIKRVSKFLAKENLFFVDKENLNYLSELHMVKGTAIHKLLTDEFIELAKKRNRKLIAEQYFYTDKFGGLGGKPDLFFPDDSLLVDIKTGNVYDKSSPFFLPYYIQMLLLSWLLMEHNYNVEKIYLWYVLSNEHVEVKYNEKHVNAILNRIQTLRSLLEIIHNTSIESQNSNDNIWFWDILQKEKEKLITLKETSLCNYCVHKSTCQMVSNRLQISKTSNEQKIVEVNENTRIKM